MNLPLDRELLTQLAIVAGVCLGGWMVLVEPRVDELRQVDAVNFQKQERAASFKPMPVEQIAVQTDRLNARCDEIEIRSRLSADTAQLFSVIMGLAAEHHVEVNNLQPRVEGAPGSSAMSITKIDMIVEGEYAALVAFLAALRDLQAYVRAGSVQITPSAEKNATMASMQLGCDALSFTLPEVVQRLRRGAGDE